MTQVNANLLRFGNIAAFIITLAINSLANTTVFNGRTTGQVSDLYPTLVTPAGYVFAIWGIIYVLLLAFVIYQALPSQKDKPFQKQIGLIFILSSLLNCVWLFLWQYDFITESVIVMFALLASLIAIYLRLNIGKAKVSLKEKLLVHLPFSVYLGWITIAAIANVASALVSANWGGFGLSPEIWAVTVLTVALVITLAVIVKRRDIAYSLVIVWALGGIAVKQNTSQNVVTTAEIAIGVILFVLALAIAIYRLRYKKTEHEQFQDDAKFPSNTMCL
ncbi:MAG: TspO/MBR family protein [Candidatus Bathyarchaeia archaeon]